MAYDIGPKIGIEGDKAFRDALKAVNSQIKETAEELKTLSKQYDGNFDSVEGAAAKQKALSDAMGAAKDKIFLVTEEYKKQREELDRLGDALDQAKRDFGPNSDETLKAQNAYNSQVTAVNNLATQIENAKGKLADYTNQMNELGEKAKTTAERLQDVGEKISGIGEGISGFGGGLEKAGGVLTKTATLPIVGTLTAAVNKGNEFEASMSQVEAITGAVGNDLDRLKDTAIKLGADSKYSATEVAEAMYYMGMAGWKTEDIIDGVGGVLNLAAAGNIDLASASDIVTDAMTAFGYKAKDCAKFVDILAVTASSSNTDVLKMGETFKYVAPAAGAAGFSVEDVALAMGLMANQGIKSSQAGTVLRSVITRISTDAGASTKSLGALGVLTEELGVQFYNADGSVRDFGDVLSECREAWKGLTAEEQANYAKKIAGQEAYSGWMAIMNATDEEVKDLDNSLNSATGSAERMAGTMMNNVKGSLEEAKGSLETAGIVVQEQLAPYISQAAGFVKDLANSFVELDEKQQKQIIWAAGLTAAAGPAFTIGGKVVGVIGDAVTGVGNFITDIGKVKAAGGEAVDGVGGLAQVFGKIGPKGAIAVAAVAGLAAIGTAIWAIHEKAIEADIDEHFGEIYLSAKDVEDVATRLTTTDWTMKVGAVVDAKAELDATQKALEDIKQDIDKAKWKVSIGVELTPGEIESYKSSVEQYISQAQKYIEQHQYAVTLAIDTTVGADSTVGKSLTTFANAYYGEAQTQLSQLGADVSKILNDAIANGTLDEKTMAMIDGKLSQMSEITKKLENAQFKAKMDSLEIELEAGGFGIDYDSFKRLSEEINKKTQEALDQSKEALTLTLTAANLRYDAMIDAGWPKEMAAKIYEDTKTAAQEELYARQGEVIQVGLNFGFGTIEQNYQAEIQSLSRKIAQENDSFIETINSHLDSGLDDIQITMMGFANSLPEASGGLKRAIQDYLKAIEPQKEQLEAIRQECIAAGRSVPESVQEGLAEIAYWEAISGDLRGKYDWLAGQIADDPELLSKLKASGATIPTELAEAITAHTGDVYDAATGIWQSAKTGSQVGAQEVADMLNSLGAEATKGFADSMAEQYGLVQDAASGLWKVTEESSRTGADKAGKEGGRAYAAGAQGELDNNPLEPKIDSAGMTGGILAGVQAAKSAAQQELDSPPLSLKVAVEEAAEQVTGGVGAIVAAAQGVLDGNPPKTKIELGGDLGEETAAQADSAQGVLDERQLTAGIRLNSEAFLEKLEELFYLAQSDLDDEENLHAFIELHGELQDMVTDARDSSQDYLNGAPLAAEIELSQEAADRVAEDLAELKEWLQENLSGEKLEAALELGRNLEDDVKTALDGAQGVLDWYGPLSASGPEVDGTDMYNSTVDAWNGSQDFLYDNPLRVAVEVATEDVVGGLSAAFNIGSSILGYSTGGIIDKPQIAAVAEDGSEAIIPLEKNRARAQSLWIKAGEELNMFAGSAGRDRGAMAGALRDAYENNSYDERMVFGEGSIVINTQATDGARLYEDFKRRLGSEVRRKQQAYGR